MPGSGPETGDGAVVRLDQLLVARGMVPRRTLARSCVLEGKVLVDGTVVTKPGARVRSDASLQLRSQEPVFVSRGGLKLEGALAHFGEPSRSGPLWVSGRVAMDVGACTGGFTECLLRRGAVRVHAVDVGHDQLAVALREDPRVVSYEGSDIRTLPGVGETISLVAVDCSFIGLTKVLPELPRFLDPRADVVALVKPQFELGPGRVGRRGVVRDPALHREAQNRVDGAARRLGFAVRGHCRSPIEGASGNAEFFVWLRWGDC